MKKRMAGKTRAAKRQQRKSDWRTELELVVGRMVKKVLAELSPEELQVLPSRHKNAT